MYFNPIEFNKFGDPVCNPVPYCRKECGLRACLDTPNNQDLLANFYLMHGTDIYSAPPRVLLFVPGGVSIEKYHGMIDDQLVAKEESSLIRSFVAPIYISCTTLKDHQLVPDVNALIQEMTAENKANLGPSKSRDNTTLNILSLPAQNPCDSSIASIFQRDSASYRSQNKRDDNGAHKHSIQ